MAGGREEFGYPKKMATIQFEHSGQSVHGHVERHGIRFFEVRANLTGQTNTEEFQNIVLPMVFILLVCKMKVPLQRLVLKKVILYKV